MANNDQLDNTIPLLSEFFIEAFEAPELKAVECTHIAILVDTTDITKLSSPTRAPVSQDLSYPFLGWKLDDLVEFAWQFDGAEHGIVGTEFVIMDEQTLEDKTVILVTPSEGSDDVETAPRLTARSDFRSSLVTLNVKSIGVGGDEPWEEAAEESGRVIRLYDGKSSE
ncbi:hypothetical protein J4E91_001967 [Alternaria rosae]|nr:hypothetical protein J4E91_001967 [Alternaria rosae]